MRLARLLAAGTDPVEADVAEEAGGGAGQGAGHAEGEEAAAPALPCRHHPAPVSKGGRRRRKGKGWRGKIPVGQIGLERTWMDGKLDEARIIAEVGICFIYFFRGDENARVRSELCHILHFRYGGK